MVRHRNPGIDLSLGNDGLHQRGSYRSQSFPLTMIWCMGPDMSELGQLNTILIIKKSKTCAI